MQDDLMSDRDLDEHCKPVVVHVHVHESGTALAAINSALDQLLLKVRIVMTSLDTIKAAVAANKSGIASAISLIQGIKAALDAAILSGDPAQLDALSASLGSDDADLAAAVLANTPTPPAPTAAPSATVLTSSMNPAAVGAAVTLTATVTGKTPTGTVAFLDGTDSLGVGTLDASGVATLDTSFATTDAHSLTAAYSGDAANAASVSTAVDEAVSQ